MHFKIYIFVTFICIASCTTRTKLDNLNNHLNGIVIGVGPFSFEENYCNLDSVNFSGWYQLTSDSTFLFYELTSQHKLSEGTFLIEDDRITFFQSKRLLVSQVRYYADAPSPIESIIETIQERSNQSYKMEICNGKLVLIDNEGNDYGIQIHMKIKQNY